MVLADGDSSSEADQDPGAPLLALVHRRSSSRRSSSPSRLSSETLLPEGVLCALRSAITNRQLQLQVVDLNLWCSCIFGVVNVAFFFVWRMSAGAFSRPSLPSCSSESSSQSQRWVKKTWNRKTRACRGNEMLLRKRRRLCRGRRRSSSRRETILPGTTLKVVLLTTSIG